MEAALGSDCHPVNRHKALTPIGAETPNSWVSPHPKTGPDTLGLESMWLLCPGHFTGTAERTLETPLAPRELWAPHREHERVGGWLIILQIHAASPVPMNPKFQSALFYLGVVLVYICGVSKSFRSAAPPSFSKDTTPNLGWSHTRTPKSQPWQAVRGGEWHPCRPGSVCRRHVLWPPCLGSPVPLPMLWTQRSCPKFP